MKKIRVFFPFLFLLFFSCNSTNYWKVRMDIPRQPAVNLDDYEEIILTNFLVKKKAEDFDLNREIVDYFQFELKQQMKKKVNHQQVSAAKEEDFENPDFWKRFASSQNALIFTGSSGYTKEVRKALLKERTGGFQSSQKAKLEARKFYSLQLDVFLIEAKSGKVLYQRELKETGNYKNPNQTAYFAFFDLIKESREKIFRQLLGKELLQERYLIKE